MIDARRTELRRTVFELVRQHLEDDLLWHGGLTGECLSHCEGDEEASLDEERAFVRDQIREAIRLVVHS